MKTRTFKTAWGSYVQHAFLAMTLVTLCIFSLAPRTVLAHAELVSSTPSEGATVQPGLTEIVLTFDEEIGIDQSSAELVGSGDAPVSGVTSAVNRTERTKMTLMTPPLTEGSYTVKWNAFTEDDNALVNGTVKFTVAGGTSSTSPASGISSSSLPVTGAGDDLLLAIAATVAALGLLVAG